MLRALVLTRVPIVLLMFGAALAAAACTKAPEEPIKLEGNLLTISNQTNENWTHVEVWLNTYYRVTTDTIQAGGRFQAPLDVFVAGFGQRFDFRRAQIRDLRMTAQLPSGKPLEIKKAFAASGLGVLTQKPQSP